MSVQSPSILQAQAVIDALREEGVRQFAYCPGSRNAPFAYVLSAYERVGLLEVFPFAEERGAAFFAVGAAAAQAGQVPVAVVTTSGTAAAELHPALEEAHHRSLPVIAVTADRPFELRGVGASQATDQVGLYGPTVVMSLDIPADVSDGIAARVRRAVRRTLGLGGRPGPGHVNVAFRDPLVPSVPVTVPEEFASGSPPTPGREASATSASPAWRPRVPAAAWAGVSWDEVVDTGLRTIVVAGDPEPREAGNIRAVAALAAARHIPILAEPTSGLSDLPTWMPHGPWAVEVLGNRVEQVLVLGKPTLSRPVGRLLSQPDVRMIVVSDHEQFPGTSGKRVAVVPTLLDGPCGKAEDDGDARSWSSPSGHPRGDRESAPLADPSPGAMASTGSAWPGGRAVTEMAADSPTRGLRGPAREDGSGEPSLADRSGSGQQEWVELWRRVTARMSAVVRAHVREAGQRGILDQVVAAHLIWQSPGREGLWLGASNAIRSCDLAACSPRTAPVFSSRGLAGIDGTIASALGCQAVIGRPVRAVMGDLTFCYDMPTLPARPADEQDVQVIVFDDGGGSIFQSLEHGRTADAETLDRFFRVPQVVDVRAVAEACGWKALTVSSAEELRAVLARPIRGRSVVHLHTPPPAQLFHSLRKAALAEAIA